MCCTNTTSIVPRFSHAPVVRELSRVRFRYMAASQPRFKETLPLPIARWLGALLYSLSLSHHPLPATPSSHSIYGIYQTYISFFFTYHRLYLLDFFFPWESEHSSSCIYKPPPMASPLPLITEPGFLLHFPKPIFAGDALGFIGKFSAGRSRERRQVSMRTA